MRRTGNETTMTTFTDAGETPTLAWWRSPMVWLVIAGPALVVVASFATLALAIIYPDPVLETAKAANPSQLPAVQGRNHAATGGR